MDVGAFFLHSTVYLSKYFLPTLKILDLGGE